MTVWHNLRAATAAQALQFRGLSTGLDGIQFHRNLHEPRLLQQCNSCGLELSE